MKWRLLRLAAFFLVILIAAISNLLSIYQALNMGLAIVLNLVVVAVLAAGALQIVDDFQRRSELESELQKAKDRYNDILAKPTIAVLQSIVDSARQIPKNRRTVRSCLFLFPDKSQSCLSIQFHSGTFRPGELDLCFQLREGLVGDIWNNPKISIADLEKGPSTDQALIQTWKLRPEHISCTQHLQSIIAAPILLDGKGSKFAGVLAIDSEYTLAVSKLDNLDTAAWIRDLAFIASQILIILSDMEVPTNFYIPR